MRLGSAWITVTGKQGHSAYPDRALNPLPAMARLMDRLASHELDQGSDHFDASTLAVVTIDTGNPATNVIPASCRAMVNIRFNDAQTSAGLADWIRQEAAMITSEAGIDFALDEGEAIRTEYSHKYTIDGFTQLAEEAGFGLHQHWTDADEHFAVLYLAR